MVTFARLYGRAADYLQFFGAVLSALVAKGRGLPLVDSPHGQSAQSFLPLSSRGATVGWLRIAFTRGPNLRVEAYLDTGDQDSTKALFGVIRARLTSLEGGVAPLVWEPLPDRRASRIAAYLPGRIIDRPDALAALIQAAAETALALYQAVQGARDPQPASA